MGLVGERGWLVNRNRSCHPRHSYTLASPASPTQHAWRPLGIGCGAHGEPPCPRSSHRAAAFAGRVVIFGGAGHAEDNAKMDDVHT